MNRAIKVLIVDDDRSARIILQKYLEINDNVEIVGNEESTENAMKLIELQHPDVLFLDINMPHEDGLQFARRVRKENHHLIIVFTTAYRNYAPEALQVRPLDYLVKPFGLNEVMNVLDKVIKVLDEEQSLHANIITRAKMVPQKMRFKTHKGYLFVEPDQIVFIRSGRERTELVLQNNQTEKIKVALVDIEEELSQQGFMRINRSIIINLKYICKIDTRNRKCYLNCNTAEQQEFVVTRNVFKKFEEMQLLKLG